MIYSSKELATCAHFQDPRIFLNEVARYDLPMQPKRVIRGSNRYSLLDLTLALVMGELRSYGFSTAVAADLVGRLNLEVLRAVLDEFVAGIADKLIICVPQQSDLDEEFPTCVTGWQEFVHFAEGDCINSLPLDLTDILRAKLEGVF